MLKVVKKRLIKELRSTGESYQYCDRAIYFNDIFMFQLPGVYSLDIFINALKESDQFKAILVHLNLKELEVLDFIKKMVFR